MDWSTAGPMLGAILAALIASGGACAGVVRTQRETARQQFRLDHWRLSSEAYVALVDWTAWVEHWYIAGAPDPHQRPRTVTMARTAAKLTAYGDGDTAEKAFALLALLRPHVSAQDIVGREPPPAEIRELANELMLSAQRHLASPERQALRRT